MYVSISGRNHTQVEIQVEKEWSLRVTQCTQYRNGVSLIPVVRKFFLTVLGLNFANSRSCNHTTIVLF